MNEPTSGQRPPCLSLPAGLPSSSSARRQPQRGHCRAESFDVLPRLGLLLAPPWHAHIVLGAVIEPVREQI
eukprot:scaffold1957_cov110-Isochrysis_galbana.AAC.4